MILILFADQMPLNCFQSSTQRKKAVNISGNKVILKAHKNILRNTFVDDKSRGWNI